MRLLFDHNLSPRLVRGLADRYSDTTHVFLVGLDRASDMAVWTYAQTNDYMIVTKDSDFSDVSVLRGFPPKVIWLRLGSWAALMAARATVVPAKAGAVRAPMRMVCPPPTGPSVVRPARLINHSLPVRSSARVMV